RAGLGGDWPAAGHLRARRRTDRYGDGQGGAPDERRCARGAGRPAQSPWHPRTSVEAAMSEPSGKQERQRTWVGRALRQFPDPLVAWAYHWLDLVGRDGRPDHGKIFGGAAFVFGLFILWRLYPELAKTPALMPFFLGFASLV